MRTARWFVPRGTQLLFALAVLFVLGNGGCGSVGEPLPPLLHIPAPIRDFSARQQQNEVFVQWTSPLLSTQHEPLKDLALFEIRVLAIASADSPPSPEVMADQGQSLAVIRAGDLKAAAGETIEWRIPSLSLEGGIQALAVRGESRQGRAGTFSNVVTLDVVAPPSRPTGLQADAEARGVALTWEKAERAVAYQVLRRQQGGEIFAPLARTELAAWRDEVIEWDQPYEYAVVGLAASATGDVPGPASETVSLVPRDVFPPAVPEGLLAVVSAGQIELSWREVESKDLAGYRVYRVVGEETRVLNEELIPVPSFSDRDIKVGTTYRYTVTAVDYKGNESPASAEVEAEAY